MDRQEQISRLTQLADLLDSIPANKFDYSNWIVVKDGGKGLLEIGPEKPVEGIGCGTAGCALGWAITLPFAKREGYQYLTNSSAYSVALFKSDSNGNLSHSDHWLAAKHLFGLNGDETDLLFIRYAEVNGIKAGDVAFAIRNFCDILRRDSYDPEEESISPADIFSPEVVELAEEYMNNLEG